MLQRCCECRKTHKTIAAKWREKQISQACKDAKAENASPRHGLKRIGKQIGGGSAKPLKFVARDGKTNDGGEKGTLTADPKVIDGIITRAWQEIYQGNAADIPTLVENIKTKYKDRIYVAPEFKVQEITDELVHEAMTGSGKSAGGMDGWQPAELALISREVSK